MRTLLVGGLVLQGNDYLPQEVLIDGKLIEAVGINLDPREAKIIACDNQWINPGLIDIHCHGAYGVDFNNASEKDLNELLTKFAVNGVTSVFPTLVADDITIMMRQLDRLAKIKNDHPNLKGFHLEGPFINPAKAGAIPQAFLKHPNPEIIEKLIAAARGLKIIMTISPELLGAQGLVEKYKDRVIFSLGHSEADYNTTMKLIDSGARSFTHIFNAMRPLDHHDPGIVGAVLASDAYRELIVDGKHLASDTVKILSKLIPSDRLILVTDSVAATGLPDGDYRLGQANITVKESEARISGTSIRAGSTLVAYQAVKNFMAYTDFGQGISWNLMSQNPAKMLGLDDRVGTIAPGMTADIVLTNETEIVHVFQEGKQLK
ncbi:MAG: N-acetylglucosamine-6-phosphate deacetylase [Bacilli bacterium]|nr:N-acetylglucosamine-6-phosphate deacetylase [Bacilli bacterium]